MSEEGQQRAQVETSVFSKLPQRMIGDLYRIGLIDGDRENGSFRPRGVSKDLSLFLPLLSTFTPRLVPAAKENCPLQFCTGILNAGFPDDRQSDTIELAFPAGGQGKTSIDAALGCLGELAERLSLCVLGESDPRLTDRDLLQPQVDFTRLLGLSRGQIARIEAAALARSATGKSERLDLDTLPARVVTLDRLGAEGRIQMPGFGVLFNEYAAFQGQNLSFASSAGCAVWASRQGAREQALLELCERDAVAQAWYNRLGITFLPSEVVEAALGSDLSDFLAERSRFTRFIRVATDLNVHVVMAVSFFDQGRSASFGAAADWNTCAACFRAAKEMLQAELSLDLMEHSFAQNTGNGLNHANLPRQLAYAREGSILADLPIEECEIATGTELATAHSYDSLLESILDRNMEIWEFNATRPDLNIPCVKLMSPDLCSWEPRFGKKRLYDNVVERGLRAKPATEAEFASRPFPF